MEEARILGGRELWAFFPDKEVNVNQATKLERAMESLKRRATKRGLRCVERENEFVKLLVCVNGSAMLVVAFKGGIERALLRIANIEQGELDLYRRELKRGRTPKKFEAALQKLVELVTKTVEGFRLCT